MNVERIKEIHTYQEIITDSISQGKISKIKQDVKNLNLSLVNVKVDIIYLKYLIQIQVFTSMYI